MPAHPITRARPLGLIAHERLMSAVDAVKQLLETGADLDTVRHAMIGMGAVERRLAA